MSDRSTTPVLRAAVSDLPGYVPGRPAETALTAALAANESHYDPLPSVLRIVQSVAGRMNRYPDMSATALRERIADYNSVALDEVAVGPGSVGVLQQIIQALCDQGDEIVFAWRSFEAYPILVRLAGAVPVPVPLAPDESHDLDAMLVAITARTKIVILCTPNNPTGVAINHEALERFLVQVPAHVLVVIDEAYVEYVSAADSFAATDLYRRFPNVCILRTFSKAYGLAGLRVGFAIVRPHLAEGLRRVAIPFGVTALAQGAAIASLDAQSEIRDRVEFVVAERRRIIENVRSFGLDVPKSQANFIWLRTVEPTREKLIRAFADADVLVRSYVGDGVRISLADPMTNDRFVHVLGAFQHAARSLG
ncbi:histidinol-phosphate transaminase [Arthrobacter sp. KNU-44]|uniref:histidinol-phosphate transaminase n=1 Tax=Arthrobacter sp. KNU-44 TaxID=3450744 RepID=UPI003F43917C